MKKLLLILLCFPFIGFGQEKNKEISRFNFTKSNNYSVVYNKKISKKYYSSPSKFNFTKSVREYNDSSSINIFDYQNKTSYSPFNKGLIHLLTKSMQKGIQEHPSILKKKDKNDKTNEID